jgi:hypothetical protein
MIIASCAIGPKNAQSATQLGEQALKLFPTDFPWLNKPHPRKKGGNCACDFSAALTVFMRNHGTKLNIKTVVVGGKMVKARNGRGEKPAKLLYYVELQKSEVQKAADAGINISQLMKELGK